MPCLKLLFPSLALAALALSACDRGRAGADEAAAADSAEAGEEAYVPPQLTPAESAAAVAAQKAHADSMTRVIMGPEYEPPREAYVDTPEKQLASCLAQANSVDEPVRSTILKACERFRNPPPQSQP
ncbi:MAG TPA: hypothetical protein VGC13_30170 [Longimicrobium sp.]|jgi:ABC-type amino acid transport substrate-binding protein|uniref:hypothetical protein n=1 Tax=Longimicrobium sp. TaxID=2029185 RepID=UPI002ED9DA97